jgi:pilus assembly protein CpaB
MKRARIIVLLIALGAGGLAVMLAKKTVTTPPPPPLPQPTAKIDIADVLVASKDIGVGQALSAQNIAWQTWPAAAAAGFIKKANRPGAIQELSGARARTPFAAGEPIREARLVKAGSGFLAAMLPKGMRAVAMEISPEIGAGGFILPGDHVDVILTRVAAGKGEENSDSETILRNVQVLAIDHDMEEKSGQKTAVGKIATLELASRQAETLMLARRLGTISLVLRGFDDSAGPPVEDAANLGKRDGVNIVRYGVSTVTLR